MATSDGSQSVELQLEEGKVAQKRSVLHKRAEPTAPSQRKVAGVQSPAAAPAPGGAGVLAALFAAAAAKGRYDTTTAGVVIDRVTKLMWQQPAEAKEYNWSDADAYCASLALAGHAGWHLPTKDELLSLVDKSHRPTIDPTAFPDTPSDYLLWSSSPVAAVAGYAWVVDFISGGSNGDVTSNSYSVRCVH